MNKFIKIILLLSLITIFITACGKQITSNNLSVDNSKQPVVTTTLDTNQTASEAISTEENKTGDTNGKNLKQPVPPSTVNTNQATPAPKTTPAKTNKTNDAAAKNSKQPVTDNANTNQVTVSPKNTPSETSVTNDTTELVTFTVTKMYCSSCSFVVKSGIEQVAGVKNVIIDLDGNDNTKGIVKVTFDKTKTDINKIKQSVADLGYGVE